MTYAMTEVETRAAPRSSLPRLALGDVVPHDAGPGDFRIRASLVRKEELGRCEQRPVVDVYGRSGAECEARARAVLFACESRRRRLVSRRALGGFSYRRRWASRAVR